MDVERPRRAGEGARGLDDAMVVELVEVVLVHEDSVIRARGAGGRGGIGPMAHVHRYSDRDADEAGDDRDGRQQHDRSDRRKALGRAGHLDRGIEEAMDEALLGREADALEQEVHDLVQAEMGRLRTAALLPHFFTVAFMVLSDV